MIKKLSLVAILAVIFTGCVVEEDLVTGKFVDREVDGIKYTCGGKEGVTSNGGLFKCPRGSSVEFWIDGVNLGGIESIEENGIFTPEDFDFIVFRGEKKPLSKRERENLVPLISTIILSLDEDGNPDNGIKIDPKVEDALGDFFVREVKPEAPTNLVELLREGLKPLSGDIHTLEGKVRTITERTVGFIREEVPDAAGSLKPVSLKDAEEHLKETEDAIEKGEIVAPTEEEITGAEGGAS